LRSPTCHVKRRGSHSRPFTMSAKPMPPSFQNTVASSNIPTTGHTQSPHVGHKLKVIHTTARDGVIIMQDENGEYRVLC
jgi:hypothetical protein